MSAERESCPSNRRRQRALVGVFGAFLLAPALDMLVRPVSARDPTVEGRAIAPLPSLGREPKMLLEFPDACERAFADRFGLRDVLLCLHSHQCMDLFGVAPTESVLPGKQGWLFYAGERSLETWRGLNPFREDELRAWQRGLEARRDGARALGAEYAIAFGPNKESIYPDLMPDGYDQLGPTRMDQLVDWMKTHSDVRLIDLRPVLRAARAGDTPQHHLYYEEGTHWHGRGCMVAAQEILRRLSEPFPSLAGDDRAQWSMQSAWPAESWRTRMYLSAPRNRLSDWWVPPGGKVFAQRLPVDDPSERRYVREPRLGLPRAWLIHDSFGSGIEPILAERFGSLHTKSALSLDLKELAQDPPDIVLDLWVERQLATRMPESLLPTPHAGAPLGPEARIALRFEASHDVRWKLEPRTPLSTFETSGELHIEMRSLPPAPGLLMRCANADDALLLPALSGARDQDLALRLEIDSAIATEAELAWRSDESESWSAAKSLRIPLSSGFNLRWATLPASARVGRLRFRPGRSAGRTYVLHSFEVRALSGS